MADIETTFRNWVRRHPHPAKLRVDGQHDIVIGSGRQRWLDATQSFMSLDGRTAQALDKEGGVLRTIDLRSAEEEELEETAAQHSQRMVQAKAEREAEREELRMLSEQNQHVQFAKLLMQAHQQGAETVRATVGDVLQAYGALVSTLSERLVGVERALQSNINQQVNEANAAGAGGVDKMVETAVQGMILRSMSGGSAPPNGAPTNGKA